MVNTTNIIAELYKIFNAINNHYFNSVLPEVFITIKQGKTKGKNVYGTFYQKAWAHKDGEKVDDATGEIIDVVNENRIHEIAMSGEYLSRPLANMCATLCHEMVHLFCEENDIEDTSNNGVYHNAKFKIEAEKRDLIIEKAPIIGWSVTTPSDYFIEFINNLDIDDSVFNYFRETKVELAKTTVKKRWVCPLCGQQVSGKKDASVGCWECGKQMDYCDLTDEDNPEILVDNNNGLALSEVGWVANMD